MKKPVPRLTNDCGYCGGTGEVPESSTRYMPCPVCQGKDKREPPQQSQLFDEPANTAAFDPK